METQKSVSAATKHLNKTTYMVELAAIVAIIILMTATPLGYLKTGFLDITLMTIPVAVGAIVLGPKAGAICGLAFGLTSFYKGLTGGSTMLVINPFGTIMVTIVSRLLVGLLTALIFKALNKGKYTQKVSYLIASLACPVLNTILFMGNLVLFFYNTDIVQGWITQLTELGHVISNPIMFIIFAVGIQAVFEAVTCCIISTLVSKALAGMMKRSIASK